MSSFKVTENSSDNLEKKALKLISTIEEKFADANTETIKNTLPELGYNLALFNAQADVMITQLNMKIDLAQNTDSSANFVKIRDKLNNVLLAFSKNIEEKANRRNEKKFNSPHHSIFGEFNSLHFRQPKAFKLMETIQEKPDENTAENTNEIEKHGL